MDPTDYEHGPPIKVAALAINDTVWWMDQPGRLVEKCEGPFNWFVLRFHDGTETDLGGNERLDRAVPRVDPHNKARTLTPEQAHANVMARVIQLEEQHETQYKLIADLQRDRTKLSQLLEAKGNVVEMAERAKKELERQVRSQDSIIAGLRDQADDLNRQRLELTDQVRDRDDTITVLTKDIKRYRQSSQANAEHVVELTRQNAALDNRIERYRKGLEQVKNMLTLSDTEE